jgi:folylpolyglutamate synthase/dihydropteroate synthase
MKYIHVAGTNGKGSTAAMLANILHRAGYRTGLYTSPYIIRFNERIQVDGEQIPRYLVRDVWEESESGWYYELSDRSILVKTPKPKKDSFEIVISTEKFDLIGMADE